MNQGPDPRYPYNPYAAATFTPPRPPPAPGGSPLAGRGTRLVARIVDTLLIGGAGIPAFALLWGWHHRNAAAVAAVLPLLVTLLQAYLTASTGQSLAKGWLGIKIVRLDGSPAGFVASVVLREVVFFVVELIPVVGLLTRFADAVMIFGEERRCLHDLIAGTAVVVAPAAR